MFKAGAIALRCGARRNVIQRSFQQNRTLVQSSNKLIGSLRCSSTILSNPPPAIIQDDLSSLLRRSLSVSASSSAENQLLAPEGGGEIVKFLNLNNIADNPGAVKKKRRVGRGIGSSKGKTCGRGHKGQKARAGGGVHPTFEGGQTKFYKRLPKRGFKNKHAEPMLPINVGTLQNFVDMGRLRVPGPNDPPITMKDLVDAGVTKINAVKHGVKLLAKGKETLTAPLKIEISRASSEAIQAIEKAGGQITTVHYNRLALKALLKPHRFDILPKRASPPPKLMEYYTSYDKRGYLSPEVQMRKLKANVSSTPSNDGEASTTKDE
mmetsp:Transcript_7039/g.10403  ORF Transcript_7039/g.10403 Transcript_7039/m.10403 type:complete len:322 (-) Transcript_7039:82-1047(-)